MKFCANHNTTYLSQKDVFPHYFAISSQASLPWHKSFLDRFGKFHIMCNCLCQTDLTTKRKS